MKSLFISYHSFDNWFTKFMFVREFKKVGGEILETKKEKGQYLVKVSNPKTIMSLHKNWYESNINFFKQSFQIF